MLLRVFLTFLLCCVFVFGQAQSNPNSLEYVINTFLQTFDLDQPNQFRLGAYMEMKGRTSPDGRGMIMDFESLGKLSLYPENALLKTRDHKVFHLNKSYNSPVQREAFNEALHGIFESITLMGNANSDPRMLNFIDSHLAKKNLEPFDKIYLRHLLLNFGRLNVEEEMVEFQTDWVHDPSQVSTAIKDIQLSIRLDRNVLRGYYLANGGTVYVENVDRNVLFATSEEYDYNVTAFKVFLQKLFVQSVQLVVKKQSSIPQQGTLVAEAKTVGYDISPSYTYEWTLDMESKAEVQPLYHSFSWIPMMLGILRKEGVNIGDSDIIPYFINEPYFPRIYAQLLPGERKKVDRYQQRIAN
ncbi:MAG: hypothetical protein AAF399_13855 [Bacteroidota bacterium]